MKRQVFKYLKAASLARNGFHREPSPGPLVIPHPAKACILLCGIYAYQPECDLLRQNIKIHED